MRLNQTINGRKKKRKRTPFKAIEQGKDQRVISNFLLDKLELEIDDLLNISLSTPVGAVGVADVELTEAQLVEHEYWLKEQILFYKMCKHITGDVEDGNGGDFENADLQSLLEEKLELEKEVKQLQKVLFKEKLSNKLKTLFIERKTKNRDDISVSSSCSSTIPEEIHLDCEDGDKDKLSIALQAKMEEYQKVKEKEAVLSEELNSIVSENEALRMQNQDLLAQIARNTTSISDDPSNEKLEREKENRDEIIKKDEDIEFLKYITRALVLESGVNWAADEFLSSLVLS